MQPLLPTTLWSDHVHIPAQTHPQCKCARVCVRARACACTRAFVLLRSGVGGMYPHRWWPSILSTAERINSTSGGTTGGVVTGVQPCMPAQGAHQHGHSAQSPPQVLVARAPCVYPALSPCVPANSPCTHPLKVEQSPDALRLRHPPSARGWHPPRTHNSRHASPPAATISSQLTNLRCGSCSAAAGTGEGEATPSSARYQVARESSSARGSLRMGVFPHLLLTSLFGG